MIVVFWAFICMPLFMFVGIYSRAYLDDPPEWLEHRYLYSYVPIGKLRFICLCHKNKKGLVKKITRDREILAIISFFVCVLLSVIPALVCKWLGFQGGFIITAIVAIPPVVISFLNIGFYEKVRGKCENLAKSQSYTLEVTGKNLVRHARNIMREKYAGENREYSVHKEEKHTFWYDYTEYYVCVDGKREKTLVKQQKYRYSSVVETTWLTGRI